jgi:hypothetical protein
VDIRALSKIQAIVTISFVAVGVIAAGYYEFYYIPLPTARTTNSYCTQTGPASINDSFSNISFTVSAARWRIDLQPNVLQLAIGTPCVYNYTIVTLPIRCGTMCGGGVGDIIEMTKQLKVNISIASSSKNPVPNYNLTLSDLGGNFSSLFITQMTVYINSVQVSSDSSPPCYNGFE